MTDPSRRTILRGGAYAALTGLLPAAPALLAGCTAADRTRPWPLIHPQQCLGSRSTKRPSTACSPSSPPAAPIAADLYFQHARSSSVTMEDGLISRAATSVDQGVGLRVVVGDQTGYAFTEDLSLPAMLAAARTAASIAHGVQPAAPCRPHPAQPARLLPPRPPLGRRRDRRSNCPPVERLDRARPRPRSRRRESHRQLGRQRRADPAHRHHGNVFTDRRPMTRLWCMVTARKGGEVQAGSANVAARQGIEWYTDERLRFLAKEAVDRTMILFDARRPPPARCPSCSPPATAASSCTRPSATAWRPTSTARAPASTPPIGAQVASELVTVVDDATHRPRARLRSTSTTRATCPPSARAHRERRARGYLHDASRRALRARPTGNGRRESFRHDAAAAHDAPPTCSPARTTPEEIIALGEAGHLRETLHQRPGRHRRGRLRLLAQEATSSRTARSPPRSRT
jgi:TldD protein